MMDPTFMIPWLKIEFELGNYQNALDNQLKAVDFAQGGGSPYWVGAAEVLALQ